MDELQPRLIALRDAANKIISTLKYNRPDFREPINWGDIRCVATYWQINNDGFQSWRVLVSEAGGDCPKFTGYIRRELAAVAEWKGQIIDVETEW